MHMQCLLRQRQRLACKLALADTSAPRSAAGTRSAPAPPQPHPHHPPPPPSPCPQSYRAAMAVLRQQRAFIADLYERGAVDEDDREALLTAVDAAMRQLDVTGALCML